MQVNSYTLGRALTAAALILPLVAAPAFADNHEMQEGEQTQQSESPQTDDQGQAEGEAQAEGAGDTSGGAGADQPQGQQAQQNQQQDAVLAKVGEAEIRTSDVDAVIAGLPEPVRQQPPQLLVPIALDQLVLRELILQEAEADNLAEDTEVQQMVDASAEVAREDAMVRVWLTREMDERVTDEAVQKVYEDLQQASEGEELPPLDTLRPQIEQFLGQQAVTEIGNELKEGADITLYGPDGNPVATQ